MNRLTVAKTLSLVLFIALSNCDQSERNVITGVAPFYHLKTTFSEHDSSATIAKVRDFADAHGMDFLVSRDGPMPGDFNASANGKDLNLEALHVKGVGGGLDIFAVSRNQPTDESWRLTREFTCRVAKICR